MYMHLGAAQCLYDHNMTPTSLYGVSAGAIAAALLSTGKQPKEFINEARKLLPSKMLSFNWKFFFGDKGFLHFRKMEKMLTPYVPDNFAHAKIPLTIVTTDYKAKREKIFSCSDKPKTSVTKACRASCSIPILFAPVKIGQELVDGGVVNHLPVNLPSTPSIGFRLVSDTRASRKPSFILRLLTFGWITFISSILSCFIHTIERLHIDDAIFTNVITLTAPWNSLDLWGLDDEVIDKLYNIGYNTVEEKFQSGWKFDSRISFI